MRLICPNCSAQYEIDATLIPDEGRDVQCSNCGHTWFELPPAKAGFSGPESAPAPEAFDAPEPEPEEFFEEEEEQSAATKAIAAATEDVTEESPRAETEPFKDVDDPFEAAASEFMADAKPSTEKHTDESDTDDEDSSDDEQEIDLSVIAPTTLKARRPSDAADVDLLREEANRELSQRRAPPSASLESQTDLGLEDLTNRKTPSRALRARMARSSGSDTSFEDTAPVSEDNYKEPQRDLLPDIDEINSTLNQSQADPAQVSAGRSGFRMGFGLTLLLCVAAILAYAFAPEIANALPGTEGPLLRFVDLANQLRDWIDGLLA